MGSLNLPEIRFPEFTGDWKSIQFGNIGKFSKGKGISKEDISEHGTTECIRYGELYTTYNETIEDVYSKTNIDRKELVLSEANDIIIPASGETQIDIATASCVLKSGIALGSDLNIIKTHNNGVFLSYYLNNKKKIDIAKLAQGISVVHLYSSQLSVLNINLPTLPEQQKIASFFTSIDQKISQHKRKLTLLEQYKKGVMQLIFSQEIRFKDENGQEFPKWENKRLGDIGSAQMCKRIFAHQTDENGEIPFYKIGTLGGKPDAYISKKLFTEYKSKYKYPQIGYTLITCSGTVGKCVQFDGHDSYYQDSNIVWVDNKDKNVSNDFLFLLFSNYQWGKLNSTTITRIYTGDLKDICFKFPCISEQTKIANFLSAIDDKINQTQKQIEKAEVWKKGLMQQMFV